MRTAWPLKRNSPVWQAAQLLATRGKPSRVAKDVRQVLLEAPREHSRKPDSIVERVERLVEGPYLEMFSRESRPGWDAFGDEAGKFDASKLNALLGLPAPRKSPQRRNLTIEELLG